MATELMPREPVRLATQPPARLDRVVAWILLAGLVLTYASAVLLGVRHHGVSTTLWGFGVSGAFFVVHLVITCATLLLVGAREPWRATRWAWGWLILLTPVGAPAFLVFGGMTGLFRPQVQHRRLTAGWALLLALLLFTPTS